VTRRLLPLTTALALVALAAGCGGGGGSKTPADELVAESVTKTSAVKSFHLVIDVENAAPSEDGLNLKFVDGDVLVPDRMKAKVGGTFAGISISTDLIVVGDAYYLKAPFGGGWQRIVVETLPAAFFDPEKGILAVIQGASDLEPAGSEEVGGVDCDRVTGTVQADDLKPLLNTAEGTQDVGMELWIGKDDKLLRRLELTGPISPDEDEGALRRVELSQFDEPVRVVAPETS
jgi:lipoprotein LprG